MNGEGAVLEQIQGNVLTGYQTAFCARLLLCEISDPVKALEWLASVLPGVSYEEGAGSTPGYRLNLAFTYAGLKRLGVSDAELFGASTAFVQGLTRRAAQLRGATPGPDRDSTWADRPLHVVVLLQADFADPALEQRATLLELLVNNGSSVRKADGVAYKEHAAKLAEQLEGFLDRLELRVLPPPEGVAVQKRDLHHSLVRDERKPDALYPIEYFGFRDGVHNPAPLREAPEAWREFVLASSEPLLDGGSYLVLRELHQDVAAFWGQLGAGAVDLAERVMGRRRDGRPLDPDAAGGLSFVPGSNSSRCPFASHVRRASPQIEAGRAANPRLIRRGLSYMDAEGRCGLMFMAFMSDIEEQFEFIQKNWIQRANHVGQLSSHYDAVAGSGRGVPPAQTELSLGPGQAVALSQFVTPGQGAYLLVPSRLALARIVRGPTDPAARLAREDALAVQQALARAASVEEAVALIQGWLDQSDAAARFWRFVELQPEGELAIGPNLFVANPARVCAILRDDGSTYSVSEYMARMRPSTGEFMLGRDACSAAYQHESKARRLAEQVDRDEVAKTAADALLRTVKLRAGLHAFSSNPQRPILLELRALIAPVLDAVVGEFFGLPGVSSASLAIWGRATARYHFRPFPDASDRATAIQASQAYRSHVMQLLAEAGPNARERLPLKLAQQRAELRAALGEGISEDDVGRNMLGIVTGSLGATTKLFLEGLTLYVREHAKDRKLDWSAMPEGALRWDAFVANLRRARRGGPDVLYRRFRGDDGRAKLAVLWVGGAQGRDPDVLFGVGPHACPGKYAGIAMIEGMLDALAALEARFNVEYEGEYEDLRLELTPRA
jgi:Dyp-type peroxidase family